MAMERLSINIARKTWEPSDDEACVVFKDPSTMAPAIPRVAADIPGNGTPPSGGGGLKKPAASQTMHWVLRCCLLEWCWFR